VKTEGYTGEGRIRKGLRRVALSHLC